MQQHEQEGQANGHAHDEGFPYGIDPRQFGLSKFEYQQQLAHHRDMEHHNIKHEEHIRHMHEMDEARARREYHEARTKDREFWMEPICALFSLVGGALSLAFWLYCIVSIFAWIGAAQVQSDAQWCLKDIAKCERNAGPDFKVPGKDSK